ncbi:class I adenylate-forming enzyme family protein [Nocardia pseudobrasiliensis]|uniref:Acyl-CoA synthetase (AMP-forming)/AMP-acid ligase II n=1 Tax=Nocardia pseudobrasiliensis TaxID=45979 RepID=A0A370HS02_9NOCA|nr:AMP-binding protein [Nocardia pseudobrasiliensis]RDI61322.1 acyl-CoA synthetase (AMP-forming)/AMP-acid ligase II [Nocardia pseudobrasiliensis]
MNLSALPDCRAAAHPHGPALADDENVLDNTDFLTAVRRAANALRTHGIGAGDVVAVMLPNTADLIVCLFAAWRLGAAVTPMNPSLVPAEAAYQLVDAEAKVLVALGFSEELPAAKTITVRELTAADPDAAPVPADHAENALALLIYTSGTTGRPKGVMLDHANLNAMCRMIIGALSLTVTDRCLLILPLFHVNGIVVSVLSPLLAGGSTSIAGRFSAQSFFARLEAGRATYFSAVPTIYTMLSNLPEQVRPDLSAVRFAICGAAPASVELLNGFESRYGVPIIEGYGLSEGTCASTLNPLAGPRKPGTVGIPLPGQTIRIVAADGSPVPDGEPGEVLIAGPNVMRGYLNRPEETAETLVDGWLRTGDIGRIDSAGYLVLVDRAKDMIIRGGENIYPKEIETAAYQLPQIAEAAAIGRADPVYGEQPVLFVAFASGDELDVGAIDRHLRRALSKYKLPVQITILDDLPKNAVGKIDKPALRRLATPAASGH